MPEQTLDEFLQSKINDGSKKRYENNLEPYYIANQYVERSLIDYITQLQVNKAKYLEIFDRLDYTPTPIFDLKEFESVYARIYEGKYKEEEIFTEIPDIARARIVCRTLNQISFLEANFVAGYLFQSKGLKAIQVKDYSKEPTSSGYRATNYELLLPSKILNTKTDIKYELQLMTEMQHTWVELSHILFYKNPNINREEFKFSRMQMIRISGMIQSIDEMYKDIREEVKKKSGNL